MPTTPTQTRTDYLTLTWWKNIANKVKEEKCADANHVDSKDYDRPTNLLDAWEMVQRPQARYDVVTLDTADDE